VVFLRPAADCAGSPQIDGALRWLVGAPVEDTVAAATLITHGHLVRYPRVRIINSHFGGALPMLLERWDNLSRLGGAWGYNRASVPAIRVATAYSRLSRRCTWSSYTVGSASYAARALAEGWL
jgi:hypothetical protein